MKKAFTLAMRQGW